MEENYKKIWALLKELGYSQGDDVMYFHFNECCEELGIDADDINIENFCDTFNINIG